MNGFKKGDVLRGQKTNKNEAYHRIVFIDGPDEAPLAVVLTRSGNYPCNIALSGEYIKDQLYFIAHLIQKMAEWGNYDKEYELTKKDLELIEAHISGLTPITYKEYEEHTKNGCPEHAISTSAQK